MKNLLNKALIQDEEGTKKIIEKYRKKDIFKEIDRITSETSNMRPYISIASLFTYNKYNEGWSDACNILSEKIKEFLKSRL